MKIEQQYKLVAFMVEIRNSISNIPFIQVLVHLVHLFWMLVLITKITSIKSCNQSPICQLLRQRLQEYLLIENFLQIAHFLFISLIVLKIVEALVYMAFSSGIAQFLKNKLIIQIIQIAGVVSFLLSQVLIYPAIQYVVFIGNNSSILMALGLGSVIYASYFLINSNFKEWSLYAQFTLIVVPLISTNQNVVSHMMVVLFTLYKLLKTNNKITKIIYIPIITATLSNLWAHNIGENLGLNAFKSSVYLGMLTFLLMVFVYYFGQKITLFNQLDFWKALFEKTSGTNGYQKIGQLYTVDEILEIYEVIVGKAKLYFQDYVQRIQQKLRLQLKAEKFHEICEQVLDKVAQYEDSYQFKFVLIQYMILNGKSLSKILNLIHSNQMYLEKMNIRQKMEYVRVLQKLKDNYGCFRTNSQLQVAQIQQADKTIGLFVHKLEKLITVQIQFWEIFLSDKISRSQIYSKFQQLLKLRQKLRKQKQKLDQFSFYVEFRTIYDNIQKKISQYDIQSTQAQNKSFGTQINHYQELRNVENGQISHDDGDNEYLILSDQKIQRISSSLAAQIQVKKQDFVQVEWTQLFIPQICEYLQQKINQISKKNQQHTIYIPFFKNKFCFISSVGRILWYPSIDGKIKYLIRFFNLIQETYLLYNIQNGLITSFNQNFVLKFEISQAKLKNQIQKQDFTFQRLFSVPYKTIFPDHICQRNQKQQLVKKQKEFSQIQINLKGLYEQGNQKAFGIRKTRIRIYDYINVGQSGFVILELQSIKQSIKKMNSDNASSTMPLRKLQSLPNKYQNETFFCPIRNSYQSKITEKLASFKNTCRYRSYIRLIIIGVVLVSFTIFQNVYNFHLLNQRVDLYSTIQQSINEGSDQYIQISRMYKTAIKRYQATSYPLNIVKNRGKPLAESMAPTLKYQQIYLDRFVKKYLAYIHNQPNKRISYDLTFDYFNVSTNTDLTTLMDFADNFKKNIQLNQTDFIFKNYLSFRQLTFNFQKSTTYRQKIHQQHQTTIIFYIVSIVTVFIIIVVMYLASLQTENNIQHVTDIYSNITNEEVMQKINDLNEDRLKYFKKEKKKQVSNLHSYVSVSNSLLSRSSASSNIQKDIAKFSIQFLKEVTSKQFSLVQYRKHKQFKEETVPTQNKLILVTHLQKFLLLLFSLTVVGCYSLYFRMDLSNLFTQRQKVSEVFDYQKYIWDRAFAINRLNSDTYMFAVYKHKFNKTLVLPVQQNFQIQVRFEKKTDFQQILEIQWAIQNRIQSDLCKLSMGLIGVQIIPCEKYAKGAMTRGYSSAYISFINLSDQIKKKELSQIESQKCTLTYCPPQYAFDYMSKGLNSAAQTAFDIFKNMANNLIKTMIKDHYLMLLYKCFSYAFLLSVIGMFVYLQIKNSTRALQLFKIFPKNIMVKIRITNYLRKHRILDRLDQL